MKKFKLFFYPIYILVVGLVLYFCIDISIHKAAYMEKVDFALLRKLPQYTVIFLLFLGILMAVELVMENLQIFKLKRRVAESEHQILALKAKLYDKKEQPKGEWETEEETEEIE